MVVWHACTGTTSASRCSDRADGELIGVGSPRGLSSFDCKLLRQGPEGSTARGHLEMGGRGQRWSLFECGPTAAGDGAKLDSNGSWPTLSSKLCVVVHLGLSFYDVVLFEAREVKLTPGGAIGRTLSLLACCPSCFLTVSG